MHFNADKKSKSAKVLSLLLPNDDVLFQMCYIR